MEIIIITIILLITFTLSFCILYSYAICYSNKMLDKYIAQTTICLQIASILLGIIMLIKKYNLL